MFQSLRHLFAFRFMRRFGSRTRLPIGSESLSSRLAFRPQLEALEDR